jgi:hypothetical protein
MKNKKSRDESVVTAPIIKLLIRQAGSATSYVRFAGFGKK